jgi:hypothetical protein
VVAQIEIHKSDLATNKQTNKKEGGTKAIAEERERERERERVI